MKEAGFDFLPFEAVEHLSIGRDLRLSHQTETYPHPVNYRLGLRDAQHRVECVERYPSPIPIAVLDQAGRKVTRIEYLVLPGERRSHFASLPQRVRESPHPQR